MTAMSSPQKAVFDGLWLAWALAGVPGGGFSNAQPNRFCVWLLQEGTVYGSSLDSGVHLKAALLPQRNRMQLRNVHLEPCPRGALANLKPVQNAKDEPGPREIKVLCTREAHTSESLFFGLNCICI